MKIKKESEIKFVSSGLSLGGSAIRTTNQIIRTGLSAYSNEGEEQQQKEPDGYMQYLSRHEKNMLQKLSPRYKKRYNRMLKRKKDANSWSRTIWQRQNTFQDNIKRNAPASAHETANTAAASQSTSAGGAAASAGRSASTAATGTASGAATGTASTAASGAAAAGGTAAAGAATGGAAVAGAAAVEASKKVAEKVKDALSAMAEQRRMQIQDIGKTSASEENTISILGGGKDRAGETETNLFLYLAGIILIVVVLLMTTTSSSYLLDFIVGNPERIEGENALVAAAKSELEEADLNIGGYKYKFWYGLDGNWCAMFVSYCADVCGYIDSGAMPNTASVANMIYFYYEREAFYPAALYTPKAGDIIFFGNGMSHTGIVIGYDQEKSMVKVIEGNSGSSSTSPYHEGSRVRVCSYSIYYNYIVGYGVPDYPVDDVPNFGTEEEIL